jgi:hypothetical protein
LQEPFRARHPFDLQKRKAHQHHQLPTRQSIALKHTERVDTPNDALCEDLVLVQRNQRAQRRGVQEREQNAVARPVAREDLGLDQRLGCTGPKLLADLLLGLAKSKRLGLSEEVGEEDAVVFRGRDWVVGRRRGEEVGGDELCALVHELIEGVLAVGARSTPDDWL